MFQNGVDALSKIVDASLSKSSKFYLVRIIRKYEIPFWNINLSHLILRYSSFLFPLLLITVEVKNGAMCYSLTTMFTTSWRNLIWIGWSELYKILTFFFFLMQKAVSHIYHSDISLAPFWKRFLQVKQFHDAKGFYTRLPSFVILKLTVVWHMTPE